MSRRSARADFPSSVASCSQQAQRAGGEGSPGSRPPPARPGRSRTFGGVWETLA